MNSRALSSLLLVFFAGPLLAAEGGQESSAVKRPEATLEAQNSSTKIQRLDDKKCNCNAPAPADTSAKPADTTAKKGCGCGDKKPK